MKKTCQSQYKLAELLKKNALKLFCRAHRYQHRNCKLTQPGLVISETLPRWHCQLQSQELWQVFSWSEMSVFAQILSSQTCFEAVPIHWAKWRRALPSEKRPSVVQLSSAVPDGTYWYTQMFFVCVHKKGDWITWRTLWQWVLEQCLFQTWNILEETHVSKTGCQSSERKESKTVKSLGCTYILITTCIIFSVRKQKKDSDWLIICLL